MLEAIRLGSKRTVSVHGGRGTTRMSISQFCGSPTHIFANPIPWGRRFSEMSIYYDLRATTTQAQICWQVVIRRRTCHQCDNGLAIWHRFKMRAAGVAAQGTESVGFNFINLVRRFRGISLYFIFFDPAYQEGSQGTELMRQD